MEILYKLSLIYPELANELSASISMLQGEGSAGIIARGKMILKKLAEISYKSRIQSAIILSTSGEKVSSILRIFSR